MSTRQVVIALGAWAVAAVTQAAWRPPPAEGVPSVAPHPGVWSTLFLGHGSAAASALWMRTGARFAALDAATPTDAAWIEAAVTACIALDPAWKAPPRYGALMLAALGDLDAHERVLSAAIATWPDDAWFPTALGMSRYLHRGDREGARSWLEWAAATPEGTVIHARAAERIGGGR